MLNGTQRGEGRDGAALSDWLAQQLQKIKAASQWGQPRNGPARGTAREQCQATAAVEGAAAAQAKRWLEYFSYFIIKSRSRVQYGVQNDSERILIERQDAQGRAERERESKREEERRQKKCERKRVPWGSSWATDKNSPRAMMRQPRQPMRPPVSSASSNSANATVAAAEWHWLVSASASGSASASAFASASVTALPACCE